LKLDEFRGTLYVEGHRGRFLSKTKKPMRCFDPLANAIAQELPVRIPLDASQIQRMLPEQIGRTLTTARIVTVDSATRGGTRHADLTLPVDHAGEIGWNLDHPIPALIPLIPPPHFREYDDIVNLL
jgi:hypothetical protein